MKARRFLPFVFCFFAAFAGAEEAGDSLLASYQQRFDRAGLAEKTAVLSAASKDISADEFTGDLYEFALRFALDNAEAFTSSGTKINPNALTMILFAIRGIGEKDHFPASETLWQVFRTFQDNAIRIEAVHTLTYIDSGDDLAEKLNAFLSMQNALSERVNYPLMQALVHNLGITGNGASYSVLFQTLFLPYDYELIEDVKHAIGVIGSNRDDLPDFLMGIILTNPPHEKLEAFRLALRQKSIGDLEEGPLAEAALRAGLDPRFAGTEGSEAVVLKNLRMEPARRIEGLKWIPALPLALNYFSFAETAFRMIEDGENTAGAVSEKDLREEMIAAIRCLASMEDSGAARVLTLQLGLVNSEMEAQGFYDNEVVLTLVEALGVLGDRASFDNLNYMSFLPYSGPIQDSARNAIRRLSW